MDKKVMKERTKVQKGFAVFGISIGAILGTAVLALGSYASYVALQYYRIQDNQVLKIHQKSSNESIAADTSLSYTSFNIGFGAYSTDYSFFMDKSYLKDGTVLTGHYSKGLSKDDVLANTDGCIDLMKTFDSDFYAVQEADLDSDRAYHINQVQRIEDNFNNYDYTYAVNFHSAYLAYPLYDNHGKSTAGLMTLSKYKIKDSVRKSLKISTNFNKFFDLDRCYSANYIDVSNGKQLCLINIHMSAYDKGGVIRNAQIKQLNEFIESERAKENYIICAGDYNHDLLTWNSDYSYTPENLAFKDMFTMVPPPTVSRIFEKDGTCKLTDKVKVVAADNLPTLRACGRPFKQGETYVSTVDGFLVSDNVTVEEVKATNLSAGPKREMFAYSDHQPTTLKFKLNA